MPSAQVGSQESQGPTDGPSLFPWQGQTGELSMDARGDFCGGGALEGAQSKLLAPSPFPGSGQGASVYPLVKEFQ